MTEPESNTPMRIEQEELRKTADKLVLPICEFDRDLRLVYANRAGLDILGAEPSLMQTKPSIDQLVAEEFRNLVHRGIENLSEDIQPNSIFIRIVRQDGEEVPVEAWAQRLYNAGQHCGTVVYLNDMSRRNVLEAKREAMDELLRLALERSLAGLLVVGSDYKIEYVNDRLCEMLGRTRGEILHHDFREFLHPDSVRLVEERYLRRQRGEDVPPIYEFKVIHSSGRVAHVKIFSTATKTRDGQTKTIAHLYDITDEVRRREELIASEQRFRSLVENMRDGLAVDNEEGKIVYVNDILVKILDCSSAHELIGMDAHEIFADITPDMMAHKYAARRAGRSEQYEATLVSKTGRLVPVIVSASPLFDAKKKYVGSFAIISDMTGLRSAEAYATFLLDLLLHDIGNQLQLILGGIELCETDMIATKDDSKLSCMQYVRDGAERCIEIIRKVRRAEESREQPLTPTDLSATVRSEVELLRRQYNPTITLDIPDGVSVLADGALSQLIWNLLENAVKHNPSPERAVWISSRKTSKGFELSIADNGPGLTNREKEQLFKSGRRFGGVGLHIVRTLVQKYHATLSVDDRVKGDSSQGLKVTLVFKTAK